MNTILQVDTSSMAALAKPQTPGQIFGFGVAGVFLFAIFFILCIKMAAYYQKKVEEKRNNSTN